jgi:glutamate racemase
MERSSYHIGMFDSGMGGLTVLDAVQKALPHESIVYFGDTARLPYGEKSPDTVARYAIENSIFLMEHNIKVLVVACNTAASVSMDKLRKIFNIPMVDVIQPGAEKAVEVSRSGRIGVLATKGTIRSDAYQNLICKLQPRAHVVPMACPLLVPLIEEGLMQHPATKLILHDYLKPLLQEKVDTILLGCTHYPSLKSMIEECVGKDILVVDSATTCAQKVAEILHNHSLKRPQLEPVSHQFFVSDNPEKFRSLSKYFTNVELADVRLVRNN